MALSGMTLNLNAVTLNLNPDPGSCAASHWREVERTEPWFVSGAGTIP